MKSKISSCKALYIFCGPLSSQRQTECTALKKSKFFLKTLNFFQNLQDHSVFLLHMIDVTLNYFKLIARVSQIKSFFYIIAYVGIELYQNRSCHSAFVTGSWRNNLRAVSLIVGHLSSNCDWPCCCKILKYKFEQNCYSSLYNWPYEA